MNRAEKRKKAKSEKLAAKKRRLARGGGSTRYAQKLEWRRNHIGGDPIPTWAPTWEQARPIVNAALEAANA